MKIRLAKKAEFIYHKAKDYMLIMTSGGEGVCSVSIDENIKSCACIFSLSVEESIEKEDTVICYLKKQKMWHKNLEQA